MRSVKQIMIGFIDDEEDIVEEVLNLAFCDQPSIYDRYLDYNKFRFIDLIFEIGEAVYIWEDRSLTCSKSEVDTILKTVSALIAKQIYDEFFPIVTRLEDGKIAIAIPRYLPKAVSTVSNILGIVPEAFTEVSGPKSTVLIIDCEKEWLKKEYLSLNKNSWLL